jgi:hypothetical protein
MGEGLTSFAGGDLHLADAQQEQFYIVTIDTVYTRVIEKPKLRGCRSIALPFGVEVTSLRCGVPQVHKK